MNFLTEDQFIPATMARKIASNIFFRPIRSWHSNTYAGEGLLEMPKGKDKSGCLFDDRFHGVEVCSKPLSVTHRIYWNIKNPNAYISAFLSYPNGMTIADVYLWETYGTSPDDIERFDTEQEMEVKIIKVLSKVKRQ